MVRALMYLIICCWSWSVAQSNSWPAVLTVPVPYEKAPDSTKLILSTDMTVFGSYEKTHNNIAWTPHFSAVHLVQRGLFETSSDITTSAMNQYYDLSGSVVKDSVLPKGGSLGLEWTPTSRLNLRKSSSALLTTGDFGPLLKWRINEAPLRIHGGISGTGWGNDLPARIFESSTEQVNGDAGYYGGVEFGDPMQKLFGKPLYFNAEAFGRSIKQTGLATITGSGLFAADCGSGDSLFAYYGDSLSDGKENIFDNATNSTSTTWGEKTPFINTPWRIARSMQTTGALKAKERFGFQPGMIYSFTEKSVSYPSGSFIPGAIGAMSNSLSDKQERAQTLNLLLGTRDGLPIVYKGGIKVTWGSEVWLFGKDLSITAMSLYRDSLQRDSLKVKLGDHENFIAASDHYIGIQLPHDILFEYKLSAFRDSKTYTFKYIERRNGAGNGADTVRNTNDNDRITINNHFGFVARNLKTFDLELFGELTKYTLNNLRQEQSVDNLIENGYKVGTTIGYKPLEILSFNESIVADAEISDYLYKQIHKTINDPPPYQRRVFSTCTGIWKPLSAWEVKSKWNQSYYDNGKWYGAKYRDTGRIDYYAIERKTTDYSVELSLAKVGSFSRFEGGLLYQNISGQQFRNTDYRRVDRSIAEPFFEMHLKQHRLSINARMARMINLQEQNQWEIRNNWDVHLIGQATW